MNLMMQFNTRKVKPQMLLDLFFSYLGQISRLTLILIRSQLGQGRMERMCTWGISGHLLKKLLR